MILWALALASALFLVDLALSVLTLSASAGPRTVVGVMPPGFTLLGQRGDFLIPYGMTSADLREYRGRGNSYAVARLRDEVTFEQAQAEMRGIFAQLEMEVPDRNATRTVMLFHPHEQMVGEVEPALIALMSAVATRGREGRGVTLEPWIAPDGVGIMAHGPRLPGESSIDQAERIAEAAARALLVFPFSPEPFANARATVRR